MKNLKKVLAFALCIVMVAAFTVPAFAATSQTVSLTYDGALQYRNGYTTGTRVTVPLYTEGEHWVTKVTITSGDYYKEITDFDTTTSDTISNTTYTVSSTFDSDNVRTINLATSALYVDLDIAVETAEAAYTIRANSGAYGSNNNYGSSGSGTATVDNAELSVAGGADWSVTFTPNAGLEITYLNIRSNYSNKENLVKVSTSTTTVAGQTFSIAQDTSTGAVTVTCSGAKRDMFVTALTGAVATKYTLSVGTDAYTSSNVTTESLPVNTTRDITLTPVSGYYVATVTITDGTASGVITSTSQTAYVNGHTYKLTYSVNGVATLSVPAMVDDVTINVASASGKYYVVVEGSGITTNYDSLTYVQDGTSVSVVISPNYGTTIYDLYIETSNGTDYIDADADYFTIGGTIYRVSHRNDDIILYFNPIPGNVRITVNGDTYTHEVYARTDGGATVVGSTTQDVDDGDECSVVFKPVSGYSIDTITVETDSKTYSAAVSKGYITVNGTRCTISETSAGRVTVYLKNVTEDMTVTAETDYSGTSSSNLVKKGTATHATISTSPSYVEYGDSVTITVRANSGYDLSSVTLVSSGSSVTVGSRTSFTLNGQYFTVRTNTDQTVSLYCSCLTKSVTVSASTSSNGSYDYDDDYHEAYMFGVGSNRFAPEDEITRGEAVTLLARMFSGLTDDELADWDTDSQFNDVRASAWYTPYIVWAEDNGILDDLYGYSRNFAPTASITRAEFVDLVCRFTDGYDSYGYNLGYSDMTWSYWASRQIAYATGQGWINGYPDGTFGPDDALTRSQVAAIVNRATGRDGNNIVPSSFRLVTFTDVPETHWAYWEIMEAANDHYVVRTTSAGETWE